MTMSKSRKMILRLLCEELVKNKVYYKAHFLHSMQKKSERVSTLSDIAYFEKWGGCGLTRQRHYRAPRIGPIYSADTFITEQ